MTKITKDEARHLAQLSSITLGDDELGALTTDLEKIIEYIEQLNELNTDGVEPTYQVTGLQNIWRDDKKLPQIPREQLLALAPDVKNNQVKVPKVL